MYMPFPYCLLFGDIKQLTIEAVAIPIIGGDHKSGRIGSGIFYYQPITENCSNDKNASFLRKNVCRNIIATNCRILSPKS